MGQATKTSSSRVMSWLLIAGGLVVIYFLAPMLLPVWRWQNVDFPTLAATLKVDEALLRTQYTIKYRYHPRGTDDPIPWQILTMSPLWDSLGKDRENEEDLAVRCTMINDHTGAGPSLMWVGNTFKDRYFTAKAWRFPPGTFGANGKRPVIVYDSVSVEKLTFTEAAMYDTHLSSQGTWDNDDLWESRDDGWHP